MFVSRTENLTPHLSTGQTWNVCFTKKRAARWKKWNRCWKISSVFTNWEINIFLFCFFHQVLFVHHLNNLLPQCFTIIRKIVTLRWFSFPLLYWFHSKDVSGFYQNLLILLEVNIYIFVILQPLPRMTANWSFKFQSRKDYLLCPFLLGDNTNFFSLFFKRATVKSWSVKDIVVSPPES